MERQSAGMMRMEKVQPLLICFFIVFHCRSWGVEVVGSGGEEGWEGRGEAPTSLLRQARRP